jgi:hypothetical protein
MSEDKITFNVRGTPVVIYRKTILESPIESMLKDLVLNGKIACESKSNQLRAPTHCKIACESESNQLKVPAHCKNSDNDDEIYLDEDPAIFNHIINCHKYGKIYPITGIPDDIWVKISEYYGLPYEQKYTQEEYMKYFTQNIITGVDSLKVNYTFTIKKLGGRYTPLVVHNICYMPYEMYLKPHGKNIYMYIKKDIRRDFLMKRYLLTVIIIHINIGNNLMNCSQILNHSEDLKRINDSVGDESPTLCFPNGKDSRKLS